MKKIFILSLTAFALLFSLSSCMVSRYTSDTKVSQIDELALIQPRAYQLFYTTNSSVREPSLCSGSEELMTSIVTTLRYPFSDVVAADYPGDDNDIAKWIDTFSDMEPSDAKYLRVPKGLHDKIVASGHRYGIVLHSYGYIKSNDLYDKERMAKLVGDIVRAVFNSTPRYSTVEQYGNALYAAVIDTQTDRVVYFSRVLSNADHPLHRPHVTEQMRKLLKDFER